MLLKINEYVRPQSIREAYDLCFKGAVPIGGGAFLHLGDKAIETGMDLSALNLEYIKEDKKRIEIGSMTTLRALETNSITRQCFNGVIAKAASSIMGVQVRNMATVGGTVYGRFGFSDIITVLLALEAKVELYRAGVMPLEQFLECKIDRDLLIRIIVDKKFSKASFQNFRKTSSDFAVLNAAAAVSDGKLRLSIGARPAKAKLAVNAMSLINNGAAGEEAINKAAEAAAEELQFGSDARASAEYRKELCRVLAKRCMMEVL